MKPGDYGLTSMVGPAGILIQFGQMLIKDSSRYNHAFIVVNETTVVEAAPGGARYNSLSMYPDAVFSNIELTGEQRTMIVLNAIADLGTPYSFLDYLALGGKQWGFDTTWIDKRVSDSGHLICSQLVDKEYERAGVHLFDDGRLPGDVTPGDLTYVGNVIF